MFSKQHHVLFSCNLSHLSSQHQVSEMKNQSKYVLDFLEAQLAKLHAALLKVHWNSEKQETALTLPWKSQVFLLPWNKVLLSAQPSVSHLYIVLFKEND